MNDTNSPIFRKRYADLLKDANSIFDLEWLREETGSLLMKELKQKGDEAWKCYVDWEEKCQTDSQMFFASAFLKAYREELEQVKAIVNEGIDVETYKNEIDQLLWDFASENLSNRWRTIKCDDDKAKRTSAWQLSASFIHKSGKFGENPHQFFALMNRIAILNDVINGRAARHGIIYNKVYVRQITDPVEAFCEKAKTIIGVIAEMKNGKQLTSNAKGVKTVYTAHVYSERFNMVMDEIMRNYSYDIKEYLDEKSAKQAESMTTVCPFIGMVLNSEKICKPKLQNVDVADALNVVYPHMKSAVQKLSSHEDEYKDEKLLRLFEIVLDDIAK